jgi:hypothetical protein
MKNPTVWVIKEQMLRGEIGPLPMDYSKAMEYGDLKFITTHDMPLYGRSSVQEQWNRDVTEFVQEYDPIRDFVITTGQPMAILCVGYAMGSVGKAPRFLVWRREENRYRIVNFDSSFACSIA